MVPEAVFGEEESGTGGLILARRPVPQVVPARATGPQVQGRAGPGRSRRSETPQDAIGLDGAYPKEPSIRPLGRGSKQLLLGEDGGYCGLVAA